MAKRDIIRLCKKQGWGCLVLVSNSGSRFRVHDLCRVCSLNRLRGRFKVSKDFRFRAVSGPKLDNLGDIAKLHRNIEKNL